MSDVGSGPGISPGQGATPAAGWYPDPAVPGHRRWWDGRSWVGGPMPAQPVPQPQPVSPPPDPAADLAAAQKYGRWARLALWFGAAAYVLYFLFLGLLYGTLFQAVRDSMSGSGYSRRYSTPQPGLGTTLLIDFGALVFQAAMIAVGVFFILWLYRVAIIASRAGLPATWQPVWSIVGFIIPVMNFFVPYQCARDALPKDHPARGTVKLWWGSFLVMGFMILPVIIASIFSTWVAMVFAVIGAVIAVFAATVARRLIAEVNEAQAQGLGSA